MNNNTGIGTNRKGHYQGSDNPNADSVNFSFGSGKHKTHLTFVSATMGNIESNDDQSESLSQEEA